MTIRNRLAIRFTGLVSAILLLAFVSIYAFCWYFIASDFYRRLDRKANTLGEMLILHRLDAQLIHQLSRIRKDQLPNQKIKVFDNRDSVIYETNDAISLDVSASQIESIRQKKRKDFRQGLYYVSGIRFMTASGMYVVLASAENVYGDAFLRQLIWAMVGLFFLAIGITIFSGWFFAGDALRPMQRIDQTLNAIFPNNRDERLPIRQDNDEIGRLSATINQLLDRVAESFRLQRMFVANVSHELKNPLTQISSQLEVSLLNQRDPEAYQQTMRSVLDDVTNLASLTHELLQLSQINMDDAGSLLTDVVRIDETAWDIRSEVNAINPRYQVRIDLGELPDDPDQLTVRGNKTLLCTALKNLTENACKFSDDGQAVIAINAGNDQLQIQVLNEGPPIPAPDIPYIFEPFYRSRQTADVSGYGVGLSLVERIVRLHGGQLTVSSAPGQPTAFTILLTRQ
ncbi:sensor histidine kinase [Spirosoma oryzicola]|uniref:sensor histidine kinase n=1 Tax=Spirosoma oryzicola TaxID=2898794 RepID=UPI001E4A6E77|nr:HAMP domain-containing sensor histidine kinase [Spirosoma oryzicola]UHG92348.1 HAMP domain-containing histidine kinase [Spirosoma oryzicola]